MPTCVDGYKTVITISFEQRNGNWTYVANLSHEKCSLELGPIFAALFLILFFIAAFLLSALILVTISTSHTLKKVLVNHYLINLCATVMIDGLFNIIMSVCYVSLKYWKFGYYACYFNSFTVTLLSVQMGFSILLLVIDRILVAKKLGAYMSLSKCSIRFFIILTWLISFAMSVPLSWGFIESVPYRNRYLCSVADSRDQYFLLPQITIVIIGVTVMLIVCVIITIWIFHREQKKHKKMKGNQSASYFDHILMIPYYKNEAYHTVYTSLLVIGYIVFWFPFTCVIALTPLYTNDWNGKTTPFGTIKRIPEFHLDSSALFTRMSTKDATRNATDIFNSTSNNTDFSNIIPEMLDTPARETVFVWLRYLFDVLVPLLIMIIIKEIRYKCRALIFVCRPNTVDSSSKILSPPYLNASFRNGIKDKKQKSENMVNFRTPVLFATSDGLYIRTVDDSLQESNGSKNLLIFSKNSQVEPHFNYDLCDVTLGGEDFSELEANFQTPDCNNDVDKDPVGINPIVEGANRTAVGKRMQTISSDGPKSPHLPNEKRPPTPPKPKSPEEKIKKEDIEMIDLEKPAKKNGKVVRFDTDLIQEINSPKINDAESVLESSIGSNASNDSGNVADIEESYPLPSKPRKLPLSKGKKKSSLPIKKIKSKPTYIHTVRPPPKIPLKRLRRQHVSKAKPTRKITPPSKKPNNKDYKRRLKNIKSRYMDYASSSNKDD
ncbi:UNVERIFIED_CONTAM: hypothetical protein RMT77_005587 [Armadillidium vulgare]